MKEVDPRPLRGVAKAEKGRLMGDKVRLTGRPPLVENAARRNGGRGWRQRREGGRDER